MRPFILSLALVLAGCGGGLLAPSGSPPKIYTLSAPREFTSAAPQANWQLVVEMPEAAQELNVARIAIAPSPERMDYYAEVTWADRPPAMLRELILQSFDKSGKIAAIAGAGGSVSADFRLATDLQSFQVEAAGDRPTVHVAISARLIRARDRRIVASRRFDTTEPAGSTFDTAIGGFDAAVHEVLPQIVDWTIEQGNRNP